MVEEIERKLPFGAILTLNAINDVRWKQFPLWFAYQLSVYDDALGGADGAAFLSLTDVSAMQLEYLDLFIKETMRLFPAAAQLADRVANRPTTIANYHVPKGVRKPLLVLCLDSSYFMASLFSAS